MASTTLQRTPRDQLSPEAGAAWDMLDRLTGEPAFIEAMASAPELLDLVMNQFYGRIFFGGRVDERFTGCAQLAAHGLAGFVGTDPGKSDFRRGLFGCGSGRQCISPVNSI